MGLYGYRPAGSIGTDSSLVCHIHWPSASLLWTSIVELLLFTIMTTYAMLQRLVQQQGHEGPDRLTTEGTFCFTVANLEARNGEMILIPMSDHMDGLLLLKTHKTCLQAEYDLILPYRGLVTAEWDVNPSWKENR